MSESSVTRKENRDLAGKILLELEQSYDVEPIIGLSRDTYLDLVNFFSQKLVEYHFQCMDSDLIELGFYTKTVAFSRAFDISYDESPALFDMLLVIERSVEEQPWFGSESINMLNLKNLIGKEWLEANKDFKKWSRRMFEDTGLKIGIIRMSKFFYGVVTQLT